jgi:hypothetical protein
MAWLQDTQRGNAASTQFKYDTNGNVWLYAYAVAGSTAKNDYSIGMGERGWDATAIYAGSDTQALHFIAIAKTTLASGEYGWFQIGGFCSDAVLSTTTGTVGHGIKEASGVCATLGAAPSGLDSVFGVFQSTGSTATYNILLFPLRVDGQD